MEKANQLYLENQNIVNDIINGIALKGFDEDVQQQARFEMLVALSKYDNERGSIRTFLNRVTACYFKRYFRKAKKYKRDKKECCWPSIQLSIEEILIRKEKIEQVRFFMETAELEERDRNVMARILSPDFKNYVGISKDLNLSEIAIYRSIKKLGIAFRRSLRQRRNYGTEKN